MGYFDMLGGNSQPMSLYQQILGANQPQTGLGAYLQNTQTPGTMAVAPQQPTPPPQQLPPQTAQPQPGGGGIFGHMDWRRILGAISDGLSVAGGGQPLYQMAQNDFRKMLYENQLAMQQFGYKRMLDLQLPELTDSGKNAIAAGNAYGTPGFQQAVAMDGSPLGKNYGFLQSINRPDLAGSYISAEANPQSIQTINGQMVSVPKGMVTTPMALGTAGVGAPTQAQPMTGAAAPKSQAEYDALPAGMPYTAPDGSIRTKGGAGPRGPQTFR